MNPEKNLVMEPKTFWEDLRWAEKNFNTLHEKYEGKWIAIVDEKVVASGYNLGEVEKEASQKTGKSPREITVDYIESVSSIYFT